MTSGMINRTGGWTTLLLIAGLTAGCAGKHQPTLVDVGRPMIVAIAPAMNHSGARNFDPMWFSDLMISEMISIPGVKVLPLNRVLAQLESEGKSQIESPDHALQVAQRLGADAMVVFAVTEYDPYMPPVLGLAAQLYVWEIDENTVPDPVTASKQSSPFEARADAQLPGAEYQRVFHGADQQLHDEMKTFAQTRTADRNPLGWKRFLVSQEDFLRFCCHVTATRLIRQEVAQLAMHDVRQDEQASRLSEDQQP